MSKQYLGRDFGSVDGADSDKITPGMVNTLAEVWQPHSAARLLTHRLFASVDLHYSTTAMFHLFGAVCLYSVSLVQVEDRKSASVFAGVVQRSGKTEMFTHPPWHKRCLKRRRLEGVDPDQPSRYW